MIKVQIAGTERKISDISESWVHEQIKRRQNDNISVCVRIFILQNNVNIMLSSGECGSSPSGRRKTNENENQIFDLWEKLHLSSLPINSHNLVAFLKQINN